jgi:hypothetical protein
MRYLAFLAADRTDSAQGRSSSKLAKNCLELLTYDQDGYPIVDHIGKHIHDAVAKKVDGSVVRKAYDNARANAEQFKTERNTKLAFRYGLLLNYLEDRLPIWDDVLRKAQPPKNEESAK